jgi:hypothetical protein
VPIWVEGENGASEFASMLKEQDDESESESEPDDLASKQEIMAWCLRKT